MVDPGDIAKTEIQKNFPLFGTIRTLVRYSSVDPFNAGTDYDPSTGIVTQGILSEHNPFVIFLSMSEVSYTFVEKIDDDPILEIDKVALFPSLDLPVVPKVNDIIDDTADKWKVKGVGHDPAFATWFLWVRPT